MTTLFERVTSNSEEISKIPIHVIQSLMSEVSAGRMTVSNAVDTMDLTESQSSQFIDVLTAAQQASNITRFSGRVFNYLILAESAGRYGDKLNHYLDEDNFWLMITQESNI